MLIIDSTSSDPYFNIASEEYLLRTYPDTDIFLLYVNAPSIIVGKFQNTLSEINLDFVRRKNIKVVRRLSGGGAVYHDFGNLNFSFHTLLAENDFMDFSTFTQPVIRVLNRLNIPAKLEGRNDLLVDGKKFSGNAKLVKDGKMVQHGTLLLDSQMGVLADALQVNPLKFVDKAVKSNRARVTNLIDYFPKDLTPLAFKRQLLEEMFRTNPDAKTYTWNDLDKQAIQQLAAEKYATWDWNFGFSPNYNFRQAVKIPAGFIELHLDVHKGYIQGAKVYGDFFATLPIEEFEKQLLGKKHDIAELTDAVSRLDLTGYFGKVTLSEILQLFE
ncbi:lipoate--protein ligase [Sphingobacterium suaedae]|uniref:lipoate--protein ligase n=1 Tax=Sphingobacterium suaedae TaxID=1686402 RepID=A0ABW5KBW5_9SPHI